MNNAYQGDTYGLRWYMPGSTKNVPIIRSTGQLIELAARNGWSWKVVEYQPGGKGIMQQSYPLFKTGPFSFVPVMPRL